MLSSKATSLLAVRPHIKISARQPLRSFAATPNFLLQRQPNRTRHNVKLEYKKAEVQKQLDKRRDEHKTLRAASPAERMQQRLQAELDSLQTFSEMQSFLQKLGYVPLMALPQHTEELSLLAGVAWGASANATRHTVFAPWGEVRLLRRTMWLVTFVLASFMAAMMYPLRYLAYAIQYLLRYLARKLR